MNPNVKTAVDLAEEAGFTHASKEATKLAERAVKLARAYEHYRYVTPENIAAFQERLKKATFKENSWQRSFDQLIFTPVAQYDGLPPSDVLEAVKKAKQEVIFDTFEVAHVVTITERKDPDPIVFGRIEGCDDRFFIAQWGDDVSITDLISHNEG